MFIDTHCHIDDPKLVDKEKVVESYLANGVTRVINMGCDVKSSIVSQELANRFDSLYYACGFHPNQLEEYSIDSLDFLKNISSDKKCVAIGEIGLDYHWEGFNKNKQIDAFVNQLDLAYSLKLPVSIHSRDATLDMLNILKERKNKLNYGAVMHCFSGSKETAKELINLGVYISFGGTLTFKNAVNLVEVAKFVPEDYCLTETDSPYLAPTPLRGTVNQPKNVRLVTEYLAFLKGVNVESMAEIIMNNAFRVFKKL